MLMDTKQYLLDDLAQEVLRLCESERWHRYLAAQARFHRYSPRNVLLISMQRPQASQVAGFATWRALGRTIKRGEKAISILAPIMRTPSDPDDDQARIGFRWVNVFDISQTQGDALPSPVVLLDGHDPSDIEAHFTSLTSDLGYHLRYDPLPDGVNGELRWSSSTIVVHPENPPLQRIKTIAHELGHALLHEREGDRRRAEMEAESVAFVVLQALGIDSSAYSAGYIASWIGDATEINEALLSCCANVHAASTTILDGLSRIRASSLVA
jgi:hypothetical protein